MLPRRLLFAALVVVGCGRDVVPPSTDRVTISRDRFARVLGDLVVARIEALPDTLAYVERRRAILERAGIDDADLLGYVEVHGADADLVATVYRHVRARAEALEPGSIGTLRATRGRADPTAGEPPAP